MKSKWGPVLLAAIATIAAGAWGSRALAVPACNPAPPLPICPNDKLLFANSTDLSWGAAVCAPPLYDLAIGDLGTAWATKCLSLSGPGCPAGEDDAVGQAAMNAFALPVGRGIWFVSRGATPLGDFSWNEPGGALMHDRDLELAGLCP